MADETRKPKPRVHITHAKFRYRPSFDTDVRDTFERARRRAGLDKARERKAAEKPSAVVRTLKVAQGGGK